MLLVGWGIFSLVASTGVFNNLTESQVSKIENQIIPDNKEITVTARTSGTSCEQLCQNLIIDVNLPVDTEKYTTNDLSSIFKAIPQALDSLSNEKNNIQVCFDTNDDWAINFFDDLETSEEKALIEKLTATQLPKPEFGNPEEGGYHFGMGGCLNLTMEDLRSVK